MWGPRCSRLVALLPLSLFLSSSLLSNPAHADGGNTVVGSAVQWSSSQGDLLVWPHTSYDLGTQTQYANLTWKLPSASIDAAFKFPIPIAGKIWLWRNVSHTLTVYDYGYQTFCSTAKDNTTLQNATACRNVTVATGSHTEERYYHDWDDISGSLTHTAVNGSHYYWMSNVAFAQGETKQVKWQYAVPMNSAGKWSLFVKRSQDTLDSALAGNLFVELDPWWNSTWAYQRQMSITNNNATQILKAGYTVNLTFDHASLVSASKSDAYGNDVRIAYYYASNGTYSQLDRFNTTAFNTTGTVVWFRTVADIPASGTDANYYLYYGNPSAGAPPANQSNVWNPPADGNTVLLYRFNEGSGTNVTDEKGSYNATWNGTPQYSSATRKYGLYSAGGLFLNSNVYRGGISLPNGTAEAWIYPTSSPIPGTQYAFCAFESGVAGSSHDIGFCIDTNVAIYVYQIGSGTIAVPLNQWTHVAVTWNGSVVTLYVNGRYDSSWSNTKVLNSGSTIYVGNSADMYWGASATFWRGYIDELRISNGTKTSFPYVFSPEPNVSLMGGEQIVNISLTNPQFLPAYGDPSTVFTYSVALDNPAGDSVNLTLYVNGATVNSSTFAWNANASLKWTAAAAGSYTYRLEAVNLGGSRTGRYPETGEATGPEVGTFYTTNFTIPTGATKLVTGVYWRGLADATGGTKVLLVQPDGTTIPEFGVPSILADLDTVEVSLPAIAYNVTLYTGYRELKTSSPVSGNWQLIVRHYNATRIETRERWS